MEVLFYNEKRDLFVFFFIIDKLNINYSCTLYLVFITWMALDIDSAKCQPCIKTFKNNYG